MVKEKEGKDMMKEFKVGEYGYMVRPKEKEIKKVKIEAVGRKYVTTCDGYKFEEQGRFLLDTHSGFSYKLFLTKKEAEDYQEVEKLSFEIKRVPLYKYQKCSLEQLQEIKRMLIKSGAMEEES